MTETALLTSRRFQLILGLALVVRAACWIQASAEPGRFLTPDAVGYLSLARDLNAGFLDPQSETFVVGLIRTPLYPMFLGLLLALFHDSVAAVVAAQIAISLATIWLTSSLADRLLGRRTALVCGLLLAVDPVSALFSCLVQPETLFTALLVGSVATWVTALERCDRRRAVYSGLLLGLAALTRPIGVFIPLCLAGTVLLTSVRRRTALVLCLVLSAGAPVAAWMAKNWILIGFPVFSTAGDSSLFHYRAAGALAEDEGISIEEAQTRLWSRLMDITPPAASAAELSARQRVLAWQVIVDHPKGAAMMMVRGVTRMMTGTGLTAFSNLMGDPKPSSVSAPWKRTAQGLQITLLGLVYLAVARGVVILAIQRRFLVLSVTLGVVAYLALLSAGPEAGTRFRFPATPFLAILAACGLASPLKRKGGAVPPSPADSRGGAPP